MIIPRTIFDISIISDFTATDSKYVSLMIQSANIIEPTVNLMQRGLDSGVELYINFIKVGI